MGILVQVWLSKFYFGLFLLKEPDMNNCSRILAVYFLMSEKKTGGSEGEYLHHAIPWPVTSSFQVMETNLKWSVGHLIHRVVNHAACKGRQRAVVVSTATWCAVFFFCWWGFVKVPGFHNFIVKTCYKIIIQTFLLAKVPQQKYVLLLAQWSIFIFFEEAVRGPVWIAKLAILWNETLVFFQVFIFKKWKAKFF